MGRGQKHAPRADDVIGPPRGGSHEHHVDISYGLVWALVHSRNMGTLEVRLNTPREPAPSTFKSLSSFITALEVFHFFSFLFFSIPYFVLLGFQVPF